MRDRYREICEAFRWEVPERFNIAEACCRRHARDPSRVALHWEDEEGATSTHTFGWLLEHANRLSNALAALGGAARESLARVRMRRHRRGRAGAPHLHERHDGAAERRAYATARAAGK